MISRRIAAWIAAGVLAVGILVGSAATVILGGGSSAGPWGTTGQQTGNYGGAGMMGGYGGAGMMGGYGGAGMMGGYGGAGMMGGWDRSDMLDRMRDHMGLGTGSR